MKLVDSIDCWHIIVELIGHDEYSGPIGTNLENANITMLHVEGHDDDRYSNRKIEQRSHDYRHHYINKLFHN